MNYHGSLRFPYPYVHTSLASGSCKEASTPGVVFATRNPEEPRALLSIPFWRVGAPQTKAATAPGLVQYKSLDCLNSWIYSSLLQSCVGLLPAVPRSMALHILQGSASCRRHPQTQKLSSKHIFRISSHLPLIWRRGLSGIGVSGSDSSPERDELKANMLTKPSCYCQRSFCRFH